MITRYISDEDLIAATALVSDSMLRALPEPEDCVGQFSKQFEERIEQLKKYAIRKAKLLKLKKSMVVAIIVVLIGFSMLCVFNTEVRATVAEWFKETLGTHTTYWFTSNDDGTLPKYELTWVPEGYELVFEDSYDYMYGAVYQRGDDAADGFTFDYALANNDTQLTTQSLYGSNEASPVDINGYNGDLYLSDNSLDTNTLVWLDEESGVVFSITSYMDPVDILNIASNVKLVN